jgi:dienelactone hydrolase
MTLMLKLCPPVAMILTLLAVSPASAAVKTERVEYTVAGQTFVGTLAYDDSVKDARPGVLVCHEWWGNNDYAASRAKMLAEQGYVAFALDMYGKDKLTTDPKQAGQWAGEVMGDVNVLRERAAAGLKLLAENARTDRTRLAAIGYCMGGTVALELARSGLKHTENLRVVAPFHAGKLLAQSPDDNKNIKGTVLVLHGQDDDFVPAGDIDKFHAQMKAAGTDYVFVAFSGAVHAFTNPGADAFKIPGVKYDRHADTRSWSMLSELFKEKFAK